MTGSESGFSIFVDKALKVGFRFFTLTQISFESEVLDFLLVTVNFIG